MKQGPTVHTCCIFLSRRDESLLYKKMTLCYRIWGNWKGREYSGRVLTDCDRSEHCMQSATNDNNKLHVTFRLNGADSIRHVPPHFYKRLVTGTPLVEEHQTRYWPICIDHHKTAHQILLLELKKWKGRQKFFSRFTLDVGPCFLICSVATV